MTTLCGMVFQVVPDLLLLDRILSVGTKFETGAGWVGVHNL